MVNKYIFSIFFLILLVLTSFTYADENPELKILVSDKQEKVLSLSIMKEELKQYKITLNDPYYKKEKQYKTFKLKDVLNLAYSSKWHSGDFTDLTFRAYDGYESIAVISKLENKGGYIVFRDLDYQDWEPISFTGAYPGPFYIIWTGKGQTAKNGYPWPWQLETINLVTFKDQFPEIVPKTADKNSGVYKGYELFKGRCLRCHSINGQGGKIGPDLNAPKNINEYRNADFVKSYIKDPSQFRFTNMPDHKDLSDKQLTSLINYFLYNKEKNRWSFDEKN